MESKEPKKKDTRFKDAMHALNNGVRIVNGKTVYLKAEGTEVTFKKGAKGTERTEHYLKHKDKLVNGKIEGGTKSPVQVKK